MPAATPGRPRVNPKVEQLVIRMAQENSGWGYDRIVGALANLGYSLDPYRAFRAGVRLEIETSENSRYDRPSD